MRDASLVRGEFRDADVKTALGIGAESELPTVLSANLRNAWQSPAPMQVWWSGGGPLLVFENAASHRARGGDHRRPAPPAPAKTLYGPTWPAMEPTISALMRDGVSAVLHDIPLPLVSTRQRLSKTATLLLQPIFDAEMRRVEGVLSTIVAEPEIEDARERLADQPTHAFFEAVGDLTRFLESLPDAFLTLDAKFCFTFLNPKAYELLAVAEGELLGRTAFEVFPGVIGSEFETLMRSSMSERVGGSVTSYYPDHARWYEVWCIPATSGLMLYFRDVSAEKATDAALRTTASDREAQRRTYEAILTNTPDLAYVWDLDHRFTYANEVLLRMWGRTYDEAIGRNCLELGYEPWHAAMHDREIDHIVATGQTVRGEVPFSGAFGRRMYDYILVPVFNAQGDVVAVAGTTRDVTEIKEREEELRLLAARLSESDRRKNEFLAMLAHELRNPLSPILNGIQIIQRADGDRVSRLSAAGMMERQVMHMVRLVNDLLDVSRISRGTIELRREPVALGEVLDLVTEAVEPTITALNQRLNVRGMDPSIVVDGDAVRLVQAFTNLVVNASKFSSASADIDVLVAATADRVDVTVRDYGVGIPQDMLTSIFEMFTQVELTREREHGGLGIGLTLVRSVIEQHDGTVVARSDGPGTGSAFLVSLPRVPVAEPEIGDVGGGRRHVACAAHPGGGRQSRLREFAFCAVEPHRARDGHRL